MIFSYCFFITTPDNESIYVDNSYGLQKSQINSFSTYIYISTHQLIWYE